MDAIDGENSVYVFIKVIKWFPSESKNKLKSQGINFEDLRPPVSRKRFYDNGNDDYGGTYAQDVAGLDDDFINDALDGEPDAYWNID